jgi:hypothetical protein
MNLLTKGIDSLPFKNNMKEHITTAQVVEWIVNKINTIPEVEALKYSPELSVYICSCIEISFLENQITGDKLEVYTTVYKRVFDISTVDEVVIVNILNFLHRNKLIKSKIPSNILNILKKLILKLIPSVISYN